MQLLWLSFKFFSGCKNTYRLLTTDIIKYYIWCFIFFFATIVGVSFVFLNLAKCWTKEKIKFKKRNEVVSSMVKTRKFTHTQKVSWYLSLSLSLSLLSFWKSEMRFNVILLFDYSLGRFSWKVQSHNFEYWTCEKWISII